MSVVAVAAVAAKTARAGWPSMVSRVRLLTRMIASDPIDPLHYLTWNSCRAGMLVARESGRHRYGSSMQGGSVSASIACQRRRGVLSGRTSLVNWMCRTLSCVQLMRGPAAGVSVEMAD